MSFIRPASVKQKVAQSQTYFFVALFSPTAWPLFFYFFTQPTFSFASFLSTSLTSRACVRQKALAASGRPIKASRIGGHELRLGPRILVWCGEFAVSISHVEVT